MAPQDLQSNEGKEKMYSRPPHPWGTFQDAQWMPETRTAPNPTYTVFFPIQMYL